jgi:diaminopimelate decarboxylase
VQPFTEKAGVLHVEDVPLTRIADAVGTPAYVYSSAYFQHQYHALKSALGTLDAQICYAVKANSNLSVLGLFKDLGAGFDIVSAGELQRVLAAGGDPASVLFSGVGKTNEEIDFAIKLHIGCFNVESAGELTRIAERAEMLQISAPISIRVNPDVDAQTHPYISTGLKENKFGVPADQALDLYREANKNVYLKVVGIDCHIGSQIMEVDPLRQALLSLLTITSQLAQEGIELQHIDVGGGMGVTYHDETALDVIAYGHMLQELAGDSGLRVMLEPGRLLVANGGALLTRVEYLKPASQPGQKSFAVVDCAMNDLLRPALYQAWHEVKQVTAAPAALPTAWDIVGPVCESGDFIAQDRDLALAPGQLLAVMSAGAYGMTQSSNYNSRSRPPEVLVSGDSFSVVRRRETTRDQLMFEAYPAPSSTAP